MINIQNLVFYILMFLIIGILVIVLMPSKNKSLILENYFKKSKLFIVPIIILVLSILCFCIYTSIKMPYTVSVQNVVFIFILLFNWGIFNFYETERKLAFLFFLLNLFFIVMYIRWSINVHIQLALLYYAMLFIGFHIFEETFTKRFYLRTKIIITGYYKKSELFKLVLWFFLIFIPSLIKHPIVIFTVYQPLMFHCYLFEYDFLLLFFFIYILWVGLLFLPVNFKITWIFLTTCQIYFSRRACLHYVGNICLIERSKK